MSSLDDTTGNAALAKAVGDAVSQDRLSVTQVKTLTTLAARSAKQAGAKAVSSGRWLADLTIDVSGHVPVRDLATLQTHHRGLAGALLAKPLIRNASLASGAVGAATGALAAASELNPTTWATLPIELLVETLLVVSFELKLAGELHEAAGFRVAYDLKAHGPLLARSWAETRGIDPRLLATLAATRDPLALKTTASELLGRGAREQLSDQIKSRLVRRATSNLLSFAPVMAGAVAGGELNRRMTRRFGTKLASSLHISPP